MNMYVSNLGFHVSEDDLRKLFEPFGTVTSAKVIIDRTTGHSQGFGFIEMQSGTEAKEAMTKLNGKDIEGRFISISVAKERENRYPAPKW